MRTTFIFVIFSFCVYTAYPQNHKKTIEKGDKNPTLNEIFDTFIAALKSEDDTKLMEFCVLLSPDETTLKYMRQNQISYKGIPNDLDKAKQPVSAIKDKFYQKLLKLRKDFKAMGFLSDLKRDTTKIIKTRILEIKPGLKVEGTEDNMILKTGSTILSYHLGEMIKVNGKWSLFTSLRTDYSIK